MLALATTGVAYALFTAVEHKEHHENTPAGHRRGRSCRRVGIDGRRANGTASSVSPDCDFPALFDPIGVVTGGESAVARGPYKEPDLRAGPSDSEIPQGDNDPAPDPSFQVTISVYVHVILGADGVGDVTDGQIVQQVVELNRGFAGFYDTLVDAHAHNGRVDSGFRFELVAIGRSQNNAWWLSEPGTPEEVEMKTALRQGDGTALNLYITSGAADQLLGWAYFPKILARKKTAMLDGVVVHYGSLPGGFIPSFNLGFAGVHEAGHWLGLYHTFDPEPEVAAVGVIASTTRRRWRFRRPGARSARTRAPSRDSIRSTISWTTRSTPVTRSSPPASQAACSASTGTGACGGARSEAVGEPVVPHEPSFTALHGRAPPGPPGRQPRRSAPRLHCLSQRP